MSPPNPLSLSPCVEPCAIGELCVRRSSHEGRGPFEEPELIQRRRDQVRQVHIRGRSDNLKSTAGLTQNLGQHIKGSYRDFQSNCWVNLRILQVLNPGVDFTFPVVLSLLRSAASCVTVGWVSPPFPMARNVAERATGAPAGKTIGRLGGGAEQRSHHIRRHASGITHTNSPYNRYLGIRYVGTSSYSCTR